MTLPPGRFTNILALATVALWLIVELAGWRDLAALAAGFIPLRFAAELPIPYALPEWLTPLTAAFVHANFAHLAFNMLMLFWCARFVEHAVGAGALALLYVVGAFASAFAQYLIDPMSPVPMIGASGAISAVVGAYALYYGQRRANAVGPVPARVVHVIWLAAAWVAVQALMGVAMSSAGTAIAVAAHIGGFFAGLALARPLLLWRYRRA